MKEIIIDYRFRGPPRSGNGGYVCGMLAKTLDDVVEVTLLKPVPLNVSLKIIRSDDGSATLARGEIILASAKQTDLRLDGLAAASFTQANYASRATPFVEDNRDASGCFVCGPGRREGDGLRILAGPLPDRKSDYAVYASPWVPPRDLANYDGLVAEEFIWACLDCPTGHAILGSKFDGTNNSILLGRMATRIFERPRHGEACVITAQVEGVSGRKSLAKSALYGETGALLAYARATWITVPRTKVI